MAHLAPSLVRLRTEVNATWPRRSKASDGWIGDAAHASRTSDHNPDGSGRVHAIDVTVSGIDKARLVARAIADPRTAYVISDRRIWENPAAYPGRGYWRAYTGTNPHTAHVHISSRRGSWAESTASWGVSTAAAVGGPIVVLPPALPGDPGPVSPTPTPAPDPISPTPTPDPSEEDAMAEALKIDRVIFQYGDSIYVANIKAGTYSRIPNPATVPDIKTVGERTGVLVREWKELGASSNVVANRHAFGVLIAGD